MFRSSLCVILLSASIVSADDFGSPYQYFKTGRPRSADEIKCLPPFGKLPMVTPITDRVGEGCLTKLDAKRSDPCGPMDPVHNYSTGGSRLDDLRNWLLLPPEQKKLDFFEVTFDQAARFPGPRFSEQGDFLEVDGAMIYEGMRFTAKRDGQYEVAFVLHTVHQITVRLQLGVRYLTKADKVLGDEYGAFALTLPPIGVIPTPRTSVNQPGSHFQVRHVGYSQAIRDHFDELRQASRVGSARIGTLNE